ncbi:MAG: hypothetical protein A3G34_16755 [Candidatus Lindowbacteria bacterium RIFCSPLOWO2_12_FULL_62_27]|nr:MAG: hypothetical protein A3I06_00355 [Candidatus Lindowbacteria bacterium RIFCSPLOWO2_02_FULL_62_12]OGH62878.1 MAG: hypothetical protein A3G34_16755 [Candidatus Lindowbacteria bacterium RIFCSPLOWO2_12_FULL_62_27]
MPRVLLAEDDEVVRHLVSTLLKKRGFEIEIAPDGKNAILTALTWRPHVVLMDILMPNVDGLTAVSVFRKIDALRDIPIIMLTAMNTKDKVIEAIQCGAQEYIVKPIDDIEKVTEKIDKVTAHKVDSDKPIYENLAYRLTSKLDALRVHLSAAVTLDSAKDLARLFEALRPLQPIRIELDFGEVKDLAAAAVPILSEIRESILDDAGGIELTHFTALRETAIGRKLHDSFLDRSRTTGKFRPKK